MNAPGRVLTALGLVASGWYVVIQKEALDGARDTCDQMAFRHDLVSLGVTEATRDYIRLREREPHRLHELARHQGLLLPGEIDWWVLERHNALRWPEIWGTMELEERR